MEPVLPPAGEEVLDFLANNAEDVKARIVAT